MLARKGLTGIILGIAALVAAPLSAAPIVSMEISRSSDDETWGPQTPTGTPTAQPNVYLYEAASTHNGWNFDWDVSADADPFVNSALVVTNTQATTQTFISTVTLPIAPALAGATLRSGSVGITLTDNNGDTATLGTTGPGKAIYTALVDGADAHTLHPDPFSLVATPPFNSATTLPLGSSFGIPVPVAGGPALASIGIRLEFTLTPGDSAAITSVFNIVPEPASLGVLALAGVGLLARRRRA